VQLLLNQQHGADDSHHVIHECTLSQRHTVLPFLSVNVCLFICLYGQSWSESNLNKQTNKQTLILLFCMQTDFISQCDNLLYIQLNNQSMQCFRLPFYVTSLATQQFMLQPLFYTLQPRYNAHDGSQAKRAL